MTESKKQHISLDNFEGSIELLLYLIQKGELDIFEVLLRQVTSQWMGRDETESLDDGAEFLVPTATLLLLKSQALLPTLEEISEETEAEFGPQLELLHHVADYCRFREVAHNLVSLESDQRDHFSRGASELPEGSTPTGLHHLSLSDLSELFQHALQKAERNRPRTILKEEWSVKAAMEELRERLNREERLLFADYFSPQRPRGELIARFLALLELAKLGEAAAYSCDSEIWITRMEDPNDR